MALWSDWQTSIPENSYKNSNFLGWIHEVFLGIRAKTILFFLKTFPPRFCGLGQWSLWFGGKLMMTYRCVCIYILGASPEKAMAPHSSAPAWKIPWVEEPGRLQSMGSLRVGHNWATSLSLIGKGNGNLLQCSSWRIPGTGEPGGLLSMGSHRVGHDWSDLAAAAAGASQVAQ